MNPEYLLDILGLLDDDLIREAETCTVPRRRSGHRGWWMTLAACLTVVVALGYVLTHVGGMGSAGGGAAPKPSGGVPSISNGDTQAVEGLGGQDASNGGSAAPNFPGFSDSAGDSMESVDPSAPDPQEPASGPEGERTFAVLADGTVYQATEEEVLLEPVESAIQYTIGGKESEAGFLPAGTAYVMLEPGVAAVLMGGTSPWRIFISVEP